MSSLRVIDSRLALAIRYLKQDHNNDFSSCYGPAIFLNVTNEVCKDTIVTSNQFNDLISGTIFNQPAVAVAGGISDPYFLYNTVVANNTYRNTM